MPIIRILWDELVETFLRQPPKDVTIKDGQDLILMALKDIDSRISDLEESLNKITDKLEIE